MRAGVGTDFTRRFNDRRDTVDVFIAYDLKHGPSIFHFFKFDHGNILQLMLRNYGLKDKRMHIAFHAIVNTDIIDIAVAVEVEVIYFFIRRVEPSFEIFGRRRLLEQLKGTFQTEVISRHFRLHGLGIGRCPS